MKKTWVAVPAYPTLEGSGKTYAARISNQLAHVFGDYKNITTHYYIYADTRIYKQCERLRYKSPTWTPRCVTFMQYIENLPDFRVPKINVRKRPFITAVLLCLHETRR